MIFGLEEMLKHLLIGSFIVDLLLDFSLLVSLYYSKLTKFFSLATKNFSAVLEHNKGEFLMMVPRLYDFILQLGFYREFAQTSVTL